MRTTQVRKENMANLNLVVSSPDAGVPSKLRFAMFSFLTWVVRIGEDLDLRQIENMANLNLVVSSPDAGVPSSEKSCCFVIFSTAAAFLVTALLFAKSARIRILNFARGGERASSP